jgi:hypothetical protein
MVLRCRGLSRTSVDRGSRDGPQRTFGPEASQSSDASMQTKWRLHLSRPARRAESALGDARLTLRTSRAPLPDRRPPPQWVSAAPLPAPRRTSRLLLVDRDGETPATFAAPIIENFAPVGGLHTSPKPVGTEPTLAMGLIGAFHGRLSSKKGRFFGGGTKACSAMAVKR